MNKVAGPKTRKRKTRKRKKNCTETEKKKVEKRGNGKKIFFRGNRRKKKKEKIKKFKFFLYLAIEFLIEEFLIQITNPQFLITNPLGAEGSLQIIAYYNNILSCYSKI